MTHGAFRSNIASTVRVGVAVALLVIVGSCSSAIPQASPHTPPSDRRDENTVWYLRSISPDERTISIVYTMSGVASGCERKGGALANEDPKKVVVIAYKSVTGDRNRACTEEFAYVDAVVHLKEPLRQRALVGCRPDKPFLSEDRICRDLERSRVAGIFEFSPSAPP